MPTYIPRHADGRTGPAFDFASLACLWILFTQDKPSEWTWEK